VTLAVEPDRRRNVDRRATAAVAVQFAVNGAFFACVMPRLPELRDRIDLSKAQLGMLLAAASATGLVASATASRVIARFSTRRVLLVGGAAISVGLVIVGVATHWLVMLAGLAVMLAVDVYVDVAMNMQGSWLSSRRARPITNRLHGLWSLGSVLGGLVAAGAATADVSLTAHLAVAAVVLTGTSTALSTQLLPHDEVHTTVEDGRKPADLTVSAVRRPVVWLFVAGLAMVSLEVSAINWSALRLSDDLDSTSLVAALAFVALMSGQTSMRFAGDHLTSWFGAQRLSIGSAVVASVALVTAGLVDIAWLAIAAFFIAGTGLAALAPRLYDVAARSSDGTARALGVLTAGIRAATLITPVAVGWLATWRSIGLALAVCACVAGPTFVIAVQPRGARPAAAPARLSSAG
jgi:MFS family permease